MNITRVIMNNNPSVHPGKVLLDEFLIPHGITAYKLSKDLCIPQTRISGIINGKRRITADTALRLARYFGNTAKYWLGLQDDFDLKLELQSKRSEMESIKQFNSNAA